MTSMDSCLSRNHSRLDAHLRTFRFEYRGSAQILDQRRSAQRLVAAQRQLRLLGQPLIAGLSTQNSGQISMWKCCLFAPAVP